MEKVALKVSFMDSFVITLKQSGLSILIGLVIAFYFMKVDVSGLLTISPVLFCILIFVAFVQSNMDGTYLSAEGIVHQNWRGKDQVLTWETDIDTKLLKLGYIQISSKEIKTPIVIYGKKLLEDKVSKHINKYSPQNHKLREFINEIT